MCAQPGQAGTTTGPLTVQASISATCAVNSASMGFGTYNPTLNANFDTTGTISVSCTNATSYNIGLGTGTGTGATTTNRVMMSGSDTISYRIYSDLGRTQNWGNTVGTNTVAGTGTGFMQSFTAYGRITSGQTAARPGSYSDTVTVTVTY
jgi:spore coat protein U-like protein